MATQIKQNVEVNESLKQVISRMDALAADNKKLETQLAQQTSSSTRPSGKLPSLPEVNPMEYCNAISTRSGKQLEDPKMPENEKKVQEPEIPQALENSIEKAPVAPESVEEERPYVGPPAYKPPIPFPQRLVKANLDKQFGKFLEVLKKLYINMPFVDVLSEMPTYAKFLKDILSNKRKLEEQGTAALTAECSAIIQNKAPQKLKDPGTFSIPCQIGEMTFERALCDLGASVSLMPLSLCKKLNLEDLKSTTISLQLADRSIRQPIGIVEDVHVKVGNYFIMTDFVVLQIDEDDRLPIILGRPFLATAGAVVDVKNGKLDLNIGENVVQFYLSDSLKKSSLAGTCCRVDVIERDVKHIEPYKRDIDQPELCLLDAEDRDIDDHTTDYSLLLDSHQVLESKSSKLETLSKVILEEAEEKKIEYESFPSNLHHEFLGNNSTYQMIVNADLNKEHTEQWHDRHITTKEILEGDRQAYPHRAIKIWAEHTGSFIVNSQRLKHYYQDDRIDKGDVLTLFDSSGVG